MKPYYEDGAVTIYHADCMDVLPTLGQFDLLLTDPPYGIGACNQTLGKGRKDFHRGDWDSTRPDISAVTVMAEWQCIWGGNYFSDVLPPTNDWLIWHKANDGRSFSECEMAWTNYGRQTRHLTHHWSGEIKSHPTQKPEPVMVWALSQAPAMVRTVLDPFMGSGTTLVAAKRLGKVAVGIEREERYCEIAARRLSQGALDLFGSGDAA